MPRLPTAEEATIFKAKGLDPSLYVMTDEVGNAVPISSISNAFTKRAMQFTGPATSALASVPAFGARALDYAAEKEKAVRESVFGQNDTATSLANIANAPGHLLSSGLRATSDLMKEGARREQLIAPSTDLAAQGLGMAGNLTGKALGFLVNPAVGIGMSAVGAGEDAMAKAEAQGKSSVTAGLVAAGLDATINKFSGPFAGKIAPAATSALARIGIGPTLAHIGADAAVGTGLGGGASLINNATEKLAYDPNRDLTENFGSSALTSGLMQATIGALARGRVAKPAAPITPDPINMIDMLKGKYAPGLELDRALVTFNKENNTTYEPADIISQIPLHITTTPEALAALRTKSPEVLEKAYGKQPWLKPLLDMRAHNLNDAEMRTIMQDPSTAPKIRALKAVEATAAIEKANADAVAREAAALVRAGRVEEANALLAEQKAKANKAAKEAEAAGKAEDKRIDNAEEIKAKWARDNNIQTSDANAADRPSALTGSDAEIAANQVKLDADATGLRAQTDATDAATDAAEIKAGTKNLADWQAEDAAAAAKVTTDATKADDALHAANRKIIGKPYVDWRNDMTADEYRLYRKQQAILASQPKNPLAWHQEQERLAIERQSHSPAKPTGDSPLEPGTAQESAADLNAGRDAVIARKKPAAIDSSRKVFRVGDPNIPPGFEVVDTPAGTVFQPIGATPPTTAKGIGLSGKPKTTTKAILKGEPVVSVDTVDKDGRTIQGEVVGANDVQAAIAAGKKVGGVPVVKTPVESMAARAKKVADEAIPQGVTHTLLDENGNVLGYGDNSVLDALQKMRDKNPGSKLNNFNPAPDSSGVPTNRGTSEIVLETPMANQGVRKQMKGVKPKPVPVELPVVNSTDPVPTAAGVHNPNPPMLAKAIKHYEQTLVDPNAKPANKRTAWDSVKSLHKEFTKGGREKLETLESLKKHGDADLVDKVDRPIAKPTPVVAKSATAPTSREQARAAYHENALDEARGNDNKREVMNVFKKAHAEGYLSDESLAEANQMSLDRSMGAEDVADSVEFLEKPIAPAPIIKQPGGIGSKLKGKPSSREGGFINVKPAIDAGADLVSKLTRGTVQRIKGLGATGEFAADRLRRMLTLGDQMHQKMSESVRRLEAGLSNSQRATITRWTDQRAELKGNDPFKLPANLQSVSDKLDNLRKTWGMNERVNGPYVQEGANFRPKTLVDSWTAGGLTPATIARLRAGDETLRPQLARVLKTHGFTGEEINTEWKNITAEAAKVTGQGPEFNPLRKPQSYPMPHEWQGDVFERLHSYARKSATDMAFHQNVENDPTMATLRGDFANGRGGQHLPATTLPDGTVINLDTNTQLRQLIEKTLAEAHQISSPTGDLLRRLDGITNPLAVGPVQTLNDLMAAPFTIGRTSGYGNMLRGLGESFSQYDRLSAEGKVRKGSSFQDEMRRTGEAISDATHGRAFRPVDALRSIVAGFNKANGVESLNRIMSAWSAKAAESHGQTLYDAKNWAAFEAAGIKNPASQSRQSVVDQFTIHGQQELQGSYNPLDTPTFMLPGTDNPLGKFASLARWSVGQMNRQFDSVIKPIAHGDLKPLIGLVLGGLASRELVSAFADKVLGHKPSDLTTEEWAKVGNPKPIQYALQRLASANVGGMFTQLLALTVNAGTAGYAPKNTGISTVFNLSERFQQLFAAVKDGQTLEHALPALIDGLAKDTISLYRDLSTRDIKPGQRERRLFHAYEDGPVNSTLKSNPMSLGSDFQKAETKQEIYSSALKLREAAKANPHMNLPSVRNQLEPDPKFHREWMTKLVGHDEAMKMANEAAAYDGPNGLGGYRKLLLKAINVDLGKKPQVEEYQGVPVIKMKSR